MNKEELKEKILSLVQSKDLNLIKLLLEYVDAPEAAIKSETNIIKK